MQNSPRPKRRWQVRLLRERCKGCRFCIEFCPRKALEQSNDFNKKGYKLVRAIDENCTNCGLCEMLCPEFAITITPAEEEAPAR